MARFVVDTHALHFFLANSPSLGKATKAALTAADSELIVPAIALAEALWIVDSRNLGVNVADVLTAVDSDPRITVVSLTREIVASAQNPKTISEMHDRQIVATALIAASDTKPVTLLTKDANIVASGLVPVAW